MAWVAALALGSALAAPVQLIIDTDMSTDVDDVAAVCMANELMTMGGARVSHCSLCHSFPRARPTRLRRAEAELLAVVHNTGLPTGAGAISVVNHFYGRDHIPVLHTGHLFSRPSHFLTET